jgi:hypothetical protein
VDVVQLLISLDRHPERASPHDVGCEVAIGDLCVVRVPSRLQLLDEQAHGRIRVRGDRPSAVERRAGRLGG